MTVAQNQPHTNPLPIVSISLSLSIPLPSPHALLPSFLLRFFRRHFTSPSSLPRRRGLLPPSLPPRPATPGLILEPPRGRSVPG
uniref:Uncharacterized protein n=1 Tax=Oryza meridionalis TaxID=40149 RepID=A0A0E0C2R8_9ORYZ